MTRREHMLVCAAEECTEVGQRLHKILRFGLTERRPEHTQNNAERLAQEYDDLLGAMELLREHCPEIPEPNRTEIESKKARIRYYIEYAKTQGTVSD